MNKKRIMIVDDETAFTRLLKLALEKTGQYNVMAENDPFRAVQAAKQFLPELVLMDVMMPRMDGGSLAAQLHTTAQLEQVPIVFLTAAVKREEVRARNGQIGGLPFLAKPVDLEELIRSLRLHLGTAETTPSPALANVTR